VCHRTVSGAPGWIISNSPPSDFWKSHSAIIHRTVRCGTGLSGVPVVQRLERNGRLQRKPVKALQCAQSQSRRQKAHWTVNSTCPVRHQTVWWPHLSELQRSNPNGWVTWLAHRTVRCAHRQTASPTTTLVVGAINTPQPPHFKASKFSAIAFNTRALDFTPRHKQEIKSSPKSGITPNN
jgi:hypothetical protein